MDIEFLHPGQTNRAEVFQRLGWLDTGAKHERLFLARWVGSNWAVALGQTSGRYWITQSLLVEFDERELVTRYKMVGDGELAHELVAWASRGKEEPLELGTPIEIPVRHILTWIGDNPEVHFILREQFFEFREGAGGPQDFRLSSAKISRLTSTTMVDRSGIPDPKTIGLTFHFTEKTVFGKALNVQVDLPTLTILVRYFVQSHARAP